MSGWQQSAATALLILADGTRIEGRGLGAIGHAAGEVCFNTAMTGYQEILTDPSYAGQIITFTFPHIGNVGTNDEDIETVNMAALSGVRGVVLKADVTNPANYRAAEKLDTWLRKRNIVGIAGVDTRALTARIRETGMPNGVIAHAPDGYFDEPSIMAELRAFPGLEGLDLAKEVTTAQTYRWDQTSWEWDKGYGTLADPQFHIVAIDYGAKRNILRSLADQGARVTVVPATATAADVLAHKPDGVFLSNGPGDPAATGKYAVPTIQKLMETGKPVFGICLGHQLLGLALGGTTSKMHQGHHGANHPVKDLTTGKVEITSMNHGFAVDKESLPPGVTETHVSLFDGSNAGLSVDGKPIFSVQYHPEASPGPHDSHYLFKRFLNLVRAQKGLPTVSEAPTPATPRA
jgi:carbamoyl-phosphate synthase small subunit